MVRILRHYIHRQTLYQIGIDLLLLACVVVLAWVYPSRLPLAVSPVLVLGAVLLASRVSGLPARSTSHPRVLVYGCGAQAQRVGRLLQQADPSLQLVGYYAATERPEESQTADAQPNLFCQGRSLPELVRQQHIREIVLAERAPPGNALPLHELLACKQSGVRVLDVAMHFEHRLGQIRREAMSGWGLVAGEGFHHNALRRASKRLLDLLGASLLLAVSLPIMALAAVLIALESPGPVLYRQERVGLHGRTFNMLKFRSMRVDAEQDGRARWASNGDARVTRIGRWLRRRRIDELPQLIHVLSGEMSLVGPRPERPCFVQTLCHKLPLYDLRHSVKPGITGWAQVRFHYGASVDDAAEKLQYDLYYVKNQCLLLDLVILFDTVGVVLACKGAR